MRNYVDENTPEGWLFIIDSDEELLTSSIKSPEFLVFELAVLSTLIKTDDIAIRFRQVFNEDNEVNWPTRLYKKVTLLVFLDLSTKNYVPRRT